METANLFSKSGVTYSIFPPITFGNPILSPILIGFSCARVRLFVRHLSESTSSKLQSSTSTL
mgnify:CR=1 FL=1